MPINDLLPRLNVHPEWSKYTDQLVILAGKKVVLGNDYHLQKMIEFRVAVVERSEARGVKKQERKF